MMKKQFIFSALLVGCFIAMAMDNDPKKRQLIPERYQLVPTRSGVSGESAKRALENAIRDHRPDCVQWILDNHQVKALQNEITGSGSTAAEPDIFEEIINFALEVAEDCEKASQADAEERSKLLTVPSAAGHGSAGGGLLASIASLVTLCKSDEPAVSGAFLGISLVITTAGVLERGLNGYWRYQSEKKVATQQTIKSFLAEKKEKTVPASAEDAEKAQQ